MKYEKFPEVRKKNSDRGFWGGQLDAYDHRQKLSNR